MWCEAKLSLHLNDPILAKRPEDIQGQRRVEFICYNGRGRRCRRDNLFDRCFMVPQLSHVIAPATKAFVTASKHDALIDCQTVSREVASDRIDRECSVDEVQTALVAVSSTVNLLL